MKAKGKAIKLDGDLIHGGKEEVYWIGLQNVYWSKVKQLSTQSTASSAFNIQFYVTYIISYLTNVDHCVPLGI